MRPKVPVMSDPTRDENGVDLSICWGLRERLERIDDAYRALPVSERNPAALRKAALEILNSICELVDHRSPVIDHIAEALRLADAGRIHPIFAARLEDLYVARPAESIAAIQGSAAGALEYAVCDLREQEKVAAKKIAEVLAQSGFSKPVGGHYTAAAIVKWRAACSNRDHAGLAEYDELLALLRARSAQGYGLGLLRIACEHYALADRKQS